MSASSLQLLIGVAATKNLLIWTKGSQRLKWYVGGIKTIRINNLSNKKFICLVVCLFSPWMSDLVSEKMSWKTTIIGRECNCSFEWQHNNTIFCRLTINISVRQSICIISQNTDVSLGIVICYEWQKQISNQYLCQQGHLYLCYKIHTLSKLYRQGKTYSKGKRKGWEWTM